MGWSKRTKMIAPSAREWFKATRLPVSSFHSRLDFSTKKDRVLSQPETSTRYVLVMGQRAVKSIRDLCREEMQTEGQGGAR